VDPRRSKPAMPTLLSFPDCRRFNDPGLNSHGSQEHEDSAGIRTAYSTVSEAYSRELLACATSLRCLRPLSQLALSLQVQSSKLRASGAHRVNPVGKFFPAISGFTDFFFLHDSFGAASPKIELNPN
jgi:hypothetical protein